MFFSYLPVGDCSGIAVKTAMLDANAEHRSWTQTSKADQEAIAQQCDRAWKDLCTSWKPGSHLFLCKDPKLCKTFIKSISS